MTANQLLMSESYVRYIIGISPKFSLNIKIMRCFVEIQALVSISLGSGQILIASFAVIY